MSTIATNSRVHAGGWFRLAVMGAALQRNGGGALVELALVTPIFVLLLVGAAEFAGLAFSAIEVQNAARAGVAYGSQSSTTAADNAGMQTAATNDGADVSGFAAAAKQFWSCSDAPATQHTTPPTCTTGNHLLNYVEVDTTATVTPPFQVKGLATSFTLTGKAIMRVQ